MTHDYALESAIKDHKDLYYNLLKQSFGYGHVWHQIVFEKFHSVLADEGLVGKDHEEYLRVKRIVRMLGW